MPIDERWDHLGDDDWTRFACDWLQQERCGEQEGDRDYGLSVTMMSFTARPEHQWKFILLAIGHAQNDDELGSIAAGPVEHLLAWHGEDYIDAVERQATDNPKFARAVTGVWQNKMSEEIWARVQAIQAMTEPLRYSKQD